MLESLSPLRAWSGSYLSCRLDLGLKYPCSIEPCSHSKQDSYCVRYAGIGRLKDMVIMGGTYMCITMEGYTQGHIRGTYMHIKGTHNIITEHVHPKMKYQLLTGTLYMTQTSRVHK